MRYRSLFRLTMLISGFLLLFISATFVVFQLSPVQAQDADATVTAYRLKVRASPGGEQISTFARGTGIHVFGRDKTGIWVLGSASSGVTGWVSRRYLHFRAGFNVDGLPITDQLGAVANTSGQGQSNTGGGGDGGVGPTATPGAALPIVSISARCSTESGNFFQLNVENGPMPHGLHWQGYKNGSPEGEPSGTTPPYGGTFYTYGEYPGTTFGIRIYNDGSVIITSDYAEIDCSSQ